MSQLPGLPLFLLLAPDSRGGHPFFFPHSFYLCLTSVSPFFCSLVGWAAACLPGKGSKEGECFSAKDRSFLQRLQPCLASKRHLLFWLDKIQRDEVSGCLKLEGQWCGIIAQVAKGKALLPDHRDLMSALRTTYPRKKVVWTREYEILCAGDYRNKAWWPTAFHITDWRWHLANDLSSWKKKLGSSYP